MTTEGRTALLFRALLIPIALAAACGKPAQDNRASDTSATESTPAASHVAPPRSAMAAIPPRYTFDTVRSDTVIRVDRYRSALDSSWVIWRQAVTLGLPFGAAAAPIDSSCAGNALGHNATLLPVTARTPTELARAKACRAKVYLRIVRKDLKGATTAANPEGCLDVDSATARIRRWDWRTLRKFMADTTVPAIEIGDDIARSAEWCGTLPQLVAKWDAIACAVRDSVPAEAVMLRALATQTAALGRAPTCLTTVRAQFAGIKLHGNPDSFVVQQARSAAAQKLTVVFGLNLDIAGCGPKAADTVTVRRSDGTTYRQIVQRCLPGIVGVNRPADRGFEVGAAEFIRYTAPQLASPVACGILAWSWEYVYSFYARPENRAAVKTAALQAAAKPFKSCAQR